MGTCCHFAINDLHPCQCYTSPPAQVIPSGTGCLSLRGLLTWETYQIFLEGYLSFMAENSNFHRMKAYVPFPTALPIPSSLKGDLSCLDSLPTKCRLLDLLSRHWSNQLTVCSSGLYLKNFCVSCAH